MANVSPDYVYAGPSDSLRRPDCIRFAMDTHTINATTIPTRGRSTSGQVADGYGFQVSDFGRCRFLWGSKARAVYALLKQQGQNAGETLKVGQ